MTAPGPGGCVRYLRPDDDSTDPDGAARLPLIVPDDTGRDLPSAHANAQDRPGPVHRPGPKRMVARQVAPSDCLACGQRWPCEASWQARAERAEARLAEVRAVLLEGGQGDGTARCRAIAIVGTEGAGNGE